MLSPKRHMSKSEWLRYMQVMYYVLYGLIIVLFGVVWYVNYQSLTESGERYLVVEPNTKAGLALQYGVIIYTLAAIPGALYWMKRVCGKLSKLEDIDLKYDSYYTCACVRVIVVAMAVVLSLIVYMLLGAYTPMIWLAAIGAVALVFTKPSAAKTEEELRPRDEDLNY